METGLRMWIRAGIWGCHFVGSPEGASHLFKLKKLLGGVPMPFTI